jgi:transposase
MSIVMGVDQHRAQITAEWIDLASGEISRARVRPADRVGVRRFLARFAGQQLEVALEATTGWRFLVEKLRAVGAVVHLAEPAETAASAGEQEAREDRSCGRPPSSRAAVGRAAAGVVDPTRSDPRSARAGAAASHADRASLGVAAADPGSALPPWLPATTE